MSRYTLTRQGLVAALILRAAADERPHESHEENPSQENE